MQAKLERRQQCHTEKFCKTNEESDSCMLSSIDNMITSHRQSISLPNEPILATANKVLSPKTINALTSTQMAFQTAGSEPKHHDMHAQSPLWFTGDKSEAKDTATVHKGKCC